MRRGEVWLADLEPVRGSEADKRRPVIVVSNDAANGAAVRLGRGVVTVLPLTRSVSRVFAFQVLVSAGESGLAHESKAQAEQVRSLDVVRLTDRLGALTGKQLRGLDDALRLHLDL